MDAVAAVNDQVIREVQALGEGVRRVDGCQDEWVTLMGTQSGRVNALAAELIGTRRKVEELREELRRERQQREVMQDLLVTAQLESHMAGNGVLCLRQQVCRAGVEIPRDADWAMGDKHISAILTPSEAPSLASTCISAPRLSMQDHLEVVNDSEDEGEVVVIPPPPRLS